MSSFLRAFSSRLLFPFLSPRRYTLVCINKRISGLNEIRQTRRRVSASKGPRKGSGTARRALERCMEWKKRARASRWHFRVQDSANNGRRNFISANWSSSGNLRRIMPRARFIYSFFVLQNQKISHSVFFVRYYFDICSDFGKSIFKFAYIILLQILFSEITTLKGEHLFNRENRTIL